MIKLFSKQYEGYVQELSINTISGEYEESKHIPSPKGVAVKSYDVRTSYKTPEEILTIIELARQAGYEEEEQ